MASRSVNKVILIGNLGRDAETKFTATGVAKTTFSVATSWRSKDPQTGEWRDETDWHNIVLWRQENLANYLTKGRQVYVEGRLQTRSYEDKEGKKVYATEVVAQDVLLLGGRGAEAPERTEEAPAHAPGQPRPQRAPAAPPEEPFSQAITEDDVPF
jgi:single-strand DNA-binding protein